MTRSAWAYECADEYPDGPSASAYACARVAYAAFGDGKARPWVPIKWQRIAAQRFQRERSQRLAATQDGAPLLEGVE